MTADMLPMPGLTHPEPSLPPTRAECSAVHRIERGAVLVCNLPTDHAGVRHWDEGDRVTWSAADRKPEPEGEDR